MRHSSKAALYILFMSLLVIPAALHANWVENGALLCGETMGGQSYAQAIPDGSGGAICVWRDIRTGTQWDIYVQRISSLGEIVWTSSGVPICTAPGDQGGSYLVSDATGGAIITWVDSREVTSNIFAQRVKYNGTSAWASGGVPVCSAPNSQIASRVAPDGLGGALIAWQDYRSSSDWDIYVQRLDGAGNPLWTGDGVGICTEAGDQLYPEIISDGAGGAIICWQDGRGSPALIYAQYVDAQGTVLWTSGGVAASPTVGDQGVPMVVADGSGGAIVAWEDQRSGSSQIYSQRFDSSGARQWTDAGVPFDDGFSMQFDVDLAADGAGGVIAVWNTGTVIGSISTQRLDGSGTALWGVTGIHLNDPGTSNSNPVITARDGGGAIVTWQGESGSDHGIFVQSLDASGNVLWNSGGLTVSSASHDQKSPVVVPDGDNGCVVSWHGETWDGATFVYAQSVDSIGRVGYLPHAISSVGDLPGDEGGAVSITVEPTSYDDVGWYSIPATMYNVWRRTGTAVSSTSISAENLKAAPGLKDFLTSAQFPPGSWQIVGSFAACQLDQYEFVATTTTDSTLAGIPWNVYLVSAHTAIPSVWFICEPDSGYSVDNLAPAMPLGVSGEAMAGASGIVIRWDPNTENDISHYIVHRGSHAGFIPSRITEVGQTVSTTITDEHDLWYDMYYKIYAIDRHGNASPYALLSPDDISGSDLPGVPKASYLAQNYPNPCNPATGISYAIQGDGDVSLVVYSLDGRAVRTLVSEYQARGSYEVIWNGTNEAGHEVASGTYLYRLKSGQFEDLRKMTLVK